MSKVRLRSVNDNWGGVLNLTLGSSMTKEECLEIVKKLDDISQNKFYTISIWDTLNSQYYGNVELLVEQNNTYKLVCHYISPNGKVTSIIYSLSKEGNFARHRTVHGDFEDILSRLEIVEQKLNEITE